QQICGYTPMLAGMVLSIQSFGTLISIIFAGRLFNKVDPRLMVTLGCLTAGIGSWYMANFYAEIDFWNIAGPGILRGIGSGFIFIPLTTLSLGAVSMENMGTASGLFNMVRTIGGSIGIAILVAMLTSGTQIHQSYLAAHVDPFQFDMLLHASPAAAGVAANFIRHGSGPMLGMVYMQVERQAAVMAFIDDFRIIAYIFFILTPVALLMHKPAARASAPAGH
ncbi:MAG: MFS transporter, partial [Deltaproteobacteria bacterium]|nr:MFS transporter [Deltaproteobacteria bacterium]